jgi:hypothetical protein
MTTIGVPYEDLRPRVLRSKKSFFQRVSDTHDQLLSHMRSLKVEEPLAPTRQSIERTRTTSTTSSSDSERESTEDQTRYSYTEIDYDSPASTGLLSPPLSPRETSFPIQQFPIQQYLNPGDRKPSREFVRGMQNYVQWKQSTYESSLAQRNPLSPPQTPQSSHSGASSKSARSEMSEEQMDDWLDRPMDADMHRFRKHSASWLDDSTDFEEEDKRIHVIEEHPGEEDSATEEDSFVYDSWKQASAHRQTWNTWYSTLEAQGHTDALDEYIAPDQIVEEEVHLTIEATPQETVATNRQSKLLSLPDDVLQNIAFCVDPNDAKPFRLSCMKFYDLVPAPLLSPH